MKRSLLILSVLMLGIIVHAQVTSSASKGYSKYQKQDYGDAFDAYKKALLDNDYDIVANYGMALLYSNNTFKKEGEKYNYYKAFKYIRIANTGAQKLNDAEVVAYDKIIPGFKNQVWQDYNIIEKKLVDSITVSPTIENAERFVNEFPESKFLQDVLRIRNQQEFAKA